MIIKSIPHIEKIIKSHKKKGHTIGLVPTMGSFHEGHCSLMRRARRENDIVIVSVFVNPMQLGPREDYKKYPRNIRRDAALEKKENVDYVFVPSLADMYPEPFYSFVTVSRLSELLCGLSRPGHFKGVTTVVCKLLNIIQPDRAYFGQKDYQQYCILKQMVTDLNMPVSLRLCPIVREPDGLAMSSRNRYLNKKNRIHARALHEALIHARRLIQKKEHSPQKIITGMQKIMNGRVRIIEYIAILCAEGFSAVYKIKKGKLFIGVAAYVGRTRLIDNIIVNIK